MRSVAAAILLALGASNGTLAAPAKNLYSRAVSAQTFVAPSSSPIEQSANYVGWNNGTLAKTEYVPGKSFDRIIQVWLENTNYESAATTEAFRNLSAQGLTLEQFYAVTHPSEPNYLASVAGDFFGMADDNFYHVPDNITTVFDLLEDGGKAAMPISFACYQENMPYDGYTGFNYKSKNYVTPGAQDYAYYVRKHNPCAFSDNFSGNKTRARFNRNFNDLAVDIGNNTLPQWVFITPNMVNDGHDTSPAFFSDFVEYFLVPLIKNPNFNSDKTLVLLTFDENEDYTTNNRIYTIALGGALPADLVGKTDSTYLTHYSVLSTVEANWELKNLGRGDVNTTMANVLPWIAPTVGYTNKNVSGSAIPLTNLTGVAPGPLSSKLHTTFTLPDNQTVPGAGGQGVLVLPGADKSHVASKAPAPRNLGTTPNPWNTDPGYDNSNLSTAAKSQKETSAAAAIPVSALVVTLVTVAAVVSLAL